jgi:hypothetical protein
LFWLAAHPDAESRVAEVRQPLDQLLTGEPSLVWRNLIANLKFFVFAGDPWPRYNIPGRPVFAEPVGAVLFLTGLVIALLRWRDLRYGFLVVWLIGSLGPSIVTSGAPSSIRDILGLVTVFVFPALPIVQMRRWVGSQLSGLGSQIRYWPSVLPQLLAVLAVILSLFLTVRDYFVRWPQNDVVRFDYQADLTAVAKWLEELPAEASVTVSGVSVHTMDKPTLQLASRWKVSDVRLCDTRETLVVPATQSDDAWLLIPQIVPLDEDLRRQLLNWGATESQRPSFTSYRLSDGASLHMRPTRLRTAVAVPNGPSITLPVSFGGHLAFLGYRELDRKDPDERLALLTFWRVEDPPPAQLKAFAHLMDAAGAIAAQDDGLASPSESWHPGDILVQKHVLTLPTRSSLSGVGSVRVGLYEDSTGNRLPVLTADHLELLLQAR